MLPVVQVSDILLLALLKEVLTRPHHFMPRLGVTPQIVAAALVI